MPRKSRRLRVEVWSCSQAAIQDKDAFCIFAIQTQKANNGTSVYARCYNNSNYHLFSLSFVKSYIYLHSAINLKVHLSILQTLQRMWSRGGRRVESETHFKKSRRIRHNSSRQKSGGKSQGKTLVLLWFPILSALSSERFNAKWFKVLSSLVSFYDAKDWQTHSVRLNLI